MAKEVPSNVMEKEIRLDTKDNDSYEILPSTGGINFKLTKGQENVLQVGVSDIKLPASISFFDNMHRYLEIQWQALSYGHAANDAEASVAGIGLYSIELDLYQVIDKVTDQNMNGFIRLINWALIEATMCGQACQYRHYTAYNVYTVKAFIPQVVQSGDSLVVWIADVANDLANHEAAANAVNTVFINRYSTVNLKTAAYHANMICWTALIVRDGMNRLLGLRDTEINYSGYPSTWDESTTAIVYGEPETMGSICTNPWVPAGVLQRFIGVGELVVNDPITHHADYMAHSYNPELDTGTSTDHGDYEYYKGLLLARRIKHGAIYCEFEAELSGIIAALDQAQNASISITNTHFYRVPLLQGKEPVRLNHGIDTLYLAAKDIPIISDQVAGTNNYFLDSLNILTTLSVDRTTIGDQVFAVDTKFAFTYLPITMPRVYIKNITIAFIAYLGSKLGYRTIEMENVEALEVVLKLYKEYVGP